MKRRTFNLTVFFGTMVVLLGAAAWHAFSQPRVYRSTGRLMVDEGVAFHDVIEALKSKEVIQRVADHVMKDGQAELLAGYGVGFTAMGAEVEHLIRRDHEVTFDVGARTIDVSYRHQSREVASRLAGYFSDEVFACEARRRIDEQMKRVEAIVQVAKKQELNVERMRGELAAYGEVPDAERRFAGEEQEKLEKDLLIEQQALGSSMERLRASSMGGGLSAPRCWFIGRPRPAAPDAYLREPIIWRLAWGVLVAGMISTGLGFVFKRSES